MLPKTSVVATHLPFRTPRCCCKGYPLGSSGQARPPGPGGGGDRSSMLEPLLLRFRALREVLPHAGFPFNLIIPRRLPRPPRLTMLPIPSGMSTASLVGPSLGSGLPATNPRPREKPARATGPVAVDRRAERRPSSAAATSLGGRSPSETRRRPLVLLGYLPSEIPRTPTSGSRNSAEVGERTLSAPPVSSPVPPQMERPRGRVPARGASLRPALL